MIESDGNNLVFAEPVLIGSCLFQPSLNQVERGGEVVHLEPKAALILQLLVEHAGKTVSRRELLDSGWPGLVVSDDALTQVIIKLRKALGDTSRKHEYIQTVPKRGYLLIAPVEAVPALCSGVKERGGWLSTGLAIAAGLILIISVSFLFLRKENGGQDESMPPAAEGVRPEPLSIAVLPFESLNDGERYRNFARGITADLTTDLSRFSKLRVIGLQVADDKSVSVRYLVSGSVQHISERLNLHVRLLESGSRHQLWSERYERSLDELFDVQSLISEEIVKQLAIEITMADKRRLAKRYTRNLAAYEDFLRGQSELLLRQRENNSNARGWYRQAIKKDPAFARAYAGLALSYAADYRNQWADNGALALKQAEETAKTAEQIDPNIPEVYWVLGYVSAQKRKPDDALVLLQKALALDKSYADAYALIGGINTYRGQPHLTLPPLRSAIRLNPDAGYLYYLLLGRAYFFLNNHEQAAINLRESLSRNPENLEARVYLMATAAASGDWDTAEWEANEVRLIKPDFDLNRWLETYPMTDGKQRQYLVEKLESLGF
jgi:DNA-binding winged helix-turn-helix (wHTH) protein/TolB-like protein/Flp pilus assembly protein TadD